MSALQDRLASRSDDGSVPKRRVWTLVLLAVVLAAAIPWQTRWGVVSDTSWIITMCERMLGGDRLYVDLIEANPPFTPWLFMPAVVLAHKFGISPEIAVLGYSYAICLLGLGLTVVIARCAGFAENATLFALLPLFLGLLVIFPGNAFTQREHLGMALFAPLLVLTAWRAAPPEGRTPSLPLALLAGFGGSILVLVKPYYALIVLVPALYVVWRRRSIRPLFAAEYWVIGLIGVAYVVAVLHFYPQFLDAIYPMLVDTYMRVRNLQTVLLMYGPVYLVGLLMLRLLRPGLPHSPLVAVFALASLAAMVPLIYQAKGWPYHAFPAFSLLLTALLLRTAQINPITHPPGAIEPRRKVMLAAVITAAAIPFMQTQSPNADLIVKVRAAVQNPTVALVGSDIAAGHPLTRMLGGTWISSYCSDWLGGFSLYLSATEARAGNPAGADHYRQIFDHYIDGKLDELKTKRPALIIIQKTDTAMNAALSRRQDYASFLSGYGMIAEDDNVRVMQRNAGLSQAPSPGAASD